MIASPEDWDAFLLDADYCLRRLGDLEALLAEYVQSLSDIIALASETPPVPDCIVNPGFEITLRYPSPKGWCKFEAVRRWKEITAAAAHLEPHLQAINHKLPASQREDAEPSPLRKLTHSIRFSVGLTAPSTSARPNRRYPNPSDRYPSDRSVVEAIEEAELLSPLIPAAKVVIREAVGEACRAREAYPNLRTPPAPAVAPAVENANAGKGWRQVRREAEDHVRRNPFPGVRALAKLVGCSPSTMLKAIQNSPRLRNARAKHDEAGREVSTLPLNDAIAKGERQMVEPDPADAASAADTPIACENDALLERLLAAARPTQREPLRQQLASRSRDELLALEQAMADDPDSGQRGRPHRSR